MATRINLSVEDKNKLVQYLFGECGEGKPAHGLFAAAAELFGVHRHTVYNLWARAKKQIDEGKPVLIQSGKLGAKIKKVHTFSLDRLKEIPFKDRSTIRDLAKNMNVSTKTIWNWMKEGLIRPHSNAIKPILTEANKLNRLVYCLSLLKYERELDIIKFNSMENVIHIDEKWFFLTNASSKSYKSPDELDPYRSCKSKRYITKVMFLCAVGRPLFSESGECIFDGKIGVFPFTEQVPAKRNSKNRKKGTLETKNIHSITKAVVKECIINKVIPAIKAKWPINGNKNILLQQDNAKPHIQDCDEEFREMASSDGFNIHLLCQPANSPDTNINDLGWFRSIQSLQYKKKAYTVDDLVKNVGESFEELSPIKLNKVFLSLQQCCIQIMGAKGHNNYTLPLMGKDALILQGALPDNLEVDQVQVQVRECIQYLVEHEGEFKSSFELKKLKEDLGS